MTIEQHRTVLACAPASELFPFPGGGFEPADAWSSSQGFDAVTFYEGTRSGRLRTGGTFFWQDFGNPQDFTTSPLGKQVLAFTVRTYWDPPPGFWAGFLQLKMTDTNFNTVNVIAWKQDVYRSTVPISDSLGGWATVVFPAGQLGIDLSDVFSVSFTVGATAGGPGFAGDPLVDDLRMLTARGGTCDDRLVTRR